MTQSLKYMQHKPTCNTEKFKRNIVTHFKSSGPCCQLWKWNVLTTSLSSCFVMSGAQTSSSYSSPNEGGWGRSLTATITELFLCESFHTNSHNYLQKKIGFSSTFHFRLGVPDKKSQCWGKQKNTDWKKHLLSCWTEWAPRQKRWENLRMSRGSLLQNLMVQLNDRLLLM